MSTPSYTYSVNSISNADGIIKIKITIYDDSAGPFEVDIYSRQEDFENIPTINEFYTAMLDAKVSTARAAAVKKATGKKNSEMMADFFNSIIGQKINR